MPATQTHCINCQPSPNPETEGHNYVCDLTGYLHTLATAKAPRAIRRGIVPAKRNAGPKPSSTPAPPIRKRRPVRYATGPAKP